VGLLSGIIHNYWAFVLLRVVVGATTSGVFLVAYVLAMEMVGPKYRVVAGTLCQYYYTAGFLAMAAVAYLLNKDWQLLQISLTLPSILFLSYWWVVPESVRWQISTGQYAAAQEQIGRVAARNGVQLEEGKVEAMVATVVAEKEAAMGERKASVLDLFRHRQICLQTLNICFLWMVNSGTYYGLALSASNLGGNPYYNYLISAAVEIPAYAFNLAVLNHPRVGRRLALSGCMLFAGLVLTVTIFIPKDQVGRCASHSWPVPRPPGW
jgi:OCT family organic cation transporter-like MFS transporter 4/5